MTKPNGLVVQGITHVLLDIEGTTCPVSFVADTLFPYAHRQLTDFLDTHQQDPVVQGLVAEVRDSWLQDQDPHAQSLGDQARGSVAPYLRWLIEQDRKLPPLKELQGLIWEQGYREGELVGPLFADVPSALHHWKQQGLRLAVYSSGSVAAQQLIYGYSQAGDLRPLFSHWFDTRTGAKQAATSYQRIAEQMEIATSHVLFISDSLPELEAASSTGMRVLFSDREGNPGRKPGPFERISDFGTLTIQPSNVGDRSVPPSP